MDKDLLKQALKELFESGEIEIRLITFRERGLIYTFPQVVIDDNIVFSGEPI